MVAVRAAVPSFYDDAATGMAHNFLMISTRAMRVIGVLACWGVILRIAPTAFGRVVSSLGGLAFYLHAAHYPLLAELKILLWRLVPVETDDWMLVHYASSVVLTVAIGVGTGILLARRMPSAFALMNGGRALRWAAVP